MRSKQECKRPSIAVPLGHWEPGDGACTMPSGTCASRGEPRVSSCRIIWFSSDCETPSCAGDRAKQFAAFPIGTGAVFHRGGLGRSVVRSEPARVGGSSVTFEPGACSAWHMRPLGQTLIITWWLGSVQRDGGPI